MRLPFSLFALFTLLFAGCCGVDTTSNRERLLKSDPALAQEAVLYEISMEFWERLDRLAFENEMKFLTTLKDFGVGETDEARERHAQYVKSFQRGQEKWSKIFPYIRSRTDDSKDVTFYYSAGSGEQILIVRDGKVRDRVVLSGEGAWTGDTGPSEDR